MFALLLVAALTVLTITLASRLEVLADVLLLIGASLVGGVVFLAVHPSLDWIAQPRPDEGTCGGDEAAVAVPIIERVSVDEARELLGQPLVTFVAAGSTWPLTGPPRAPPCRRCGRSRTTTPPTSPGR